MPRGTDRSWDTALRRHIRVGSRSEPSVPRERARHRFHGNKSRLLPHRNTAERGGELRRLRRVGDAGTDRIQIDKTSRAIEAYVPPRRLVKIA